MSWLHKHGRLHMPTYPADQAGHDLPWYLLWKYRGNHVALNPHLLQADKQTAKTGTLVRWLVRQLTQPRLQSSPTSGTMMCQSVRMAWGV